MVYADTTLTTQLDGAVEPDPAAGPVSGIGTSSSTQPSLMAAMLDALDLGGDERVLEIGTGTGYNAALLCPPARRRSGSRLLRWTRPSPTRPARVRARGVSNRRHRWRWQQGAPEVPPYDRVIATCSVPAYPATGSPRSATAGMIVTSLWRDLGGAPLVRLTVATVRLEGFFLPTPGGFMPVRSAHQTVAAPVHGA